MKGAFQDQIPPPPTASVTERVEQLCAQLRMAGPPSKGRPTGRGSALADETGPQSLPTGGGTWEGPQASEENRRGGAGSNTRLLASIWPFSDLPWSVLIRIAGRMQEKRLAGGTVLIRQGARSRRLMVLVEGSVEVCVEDGRQRHEIARLEKGSLLGEMGLLMDVPCTATATAVTPVRVLVLPSRWFRRLAVLFPVLSAALGHLAATRLGCAAVDSLVGKVVHGYRLRRCLGRGGMGTVYEAEALADGRRVALKMMSHRFASDLEIQQRFDREVRIGASLRHPNLGRILDHFLGLGTHCMVMEYCEGIALDELIRRRGPLPEDQVRGIAGQVAAALACVHRHGVCHRDVKPANIIVSERTGLAKLIDFGLARSLAGDGLTSQGRILGTPRYMPPEQLGGAPADPRADVFALGCVVYEMLTGESPFAAPNLPTILQRQFSWSLPPAEQVRPGVGRDLYEMLQQSLALAPAKRTADLERFSNTLLFRTAGFGHKSPRRGTRDSESHFPLTPPAF